MNPLTGVVKGLETFLAGESGIDGVDIEKEGDSDYFSEESSDSDDVEEDEFKYEHKAKWGAVSLAEDDGDIVLNMDKLLYILEAYQSNGVDSVAEKTKTRSKMSDKKKEKLFSVEKEHGLRPHIVAAVSGMGTHTLHPHEFTSSDTCVLADESISNEESSRDSDDADSNSSGSEESEEINDDDFYKEYQVLIISFWIS